MRRLLPAVLFMAAACSRPRAEDPQELYGRVNRDVEAGELIRAAAGAERGRALAVSAADPYLEWRFRLLQADVLLFSRRAEAALTVLQGQMPETARFLALSAQRLLLQSRASAILHRAEESADLLERAWQAAEASQSAEAMVDVETVRGVVLENQQRHLESDVVLKRARERARAIPSPYREAGILVDLGFNSLHRSRLDEAAGYFEEAARVATPERATLYSVAQQNLAACYTNLGEFDRAIAVQQQAVARLEKSGAKAYLTLALGELGRAYLLKGDLKQAATYMDRALTSSLEMHATRDAAVWASNLTNLYLQSGDLANAESLNQESIRLRTVDKSPLLYYNRLNAAAIAMARGDRALAARLYTQSKEEGAADPSVLWESEEGLGRLARAEHNGGEAVRHLEAAVRIVEQTRKGLDRTEFKLPFLTRLIQLYRLYVDTLLEQGEVEQALAVADSSRAQVLAERSGAAPVRRLEAGAYRDMARRTGSVLLSYWLGTEKSHAWVVTAAGTHHVELAGAREIEPLVAAYQGAVERQLADPARIRMPAGERLFAMLIAPVRQWIPAGSQVVVVSDGVLHGLNLESLPIPGAEPRYWVEEVTVSIAPSLSLLGVAPEGAPGADRRLLLIGDPASTDPAYPPLSYAAAEIAAVTREFGAGRSVVASREKATPDVWREAAPGGFRAIHFTAHATANRESPLDSAVVLAGGKLYARDVMATPLAADLVTVSACRGAGARLYSGEGLVGFAWAFLHAGAKHVIAGLWDVNDQSTSKLMETLYRELAAGKSAAVALRTAKLELVRSGGNLRKPYYWAPFQVYRVGR